MIVEKHSRLPRKYDPDVAKASIVQDNKEPGRQIAPLKDVDPKSVLERYLAEESTSDIAKSLGVTRSGLNYWLLRIAEEEWKSVQVVRALKRKEKAEETMEAAADPLTLARARELLKAAQWDLERVCRRIYGEEKAQVNVAITPVLNITVASGEMQSVQVIDSK